MKNLLITVSIYLLQISFLIGGVYFNQKELLNISLWSIWAIIIIFCIFALFTDSEKIYKKKVKYKLIPRLFAIILLFSLVALGYFWTASFYALVWFMCFGKRSIWEEDQLKKDKEK